MKAAVLKAFGQPLSIETVPDPVAGPGEVVVDVAATRMLAYAGEVFDGTRDYALVLPVVPGPGGIGRVRALGPDATQLKVGEWVYLDPTVRARDSAQAPDILLQGLTAPSEGARRLHAHFHDGSFAERTRVPLENAKPLGDIAAADVGRWCALGTLLVPYGGWLAAGLQAGETVVVNGATGAFGSAGVAVALAMGAGCVVATGRNEAALRDVGTRFGPRVRAVRMRGDEAADRDRIVAAAPAPIDVVLDILPPAATPAQVRAALLAVRPNGRVVLMGGVGMAGGPGLELPYPWIMRNNITVRGQWMYPPDAAGRLAALVRSGLLPLDPFEISEFPLDRVNEAVAHAATNAGPFRMTILRP
ncbi:zinc-binding dehydrogenase [Reyranella sp.]|uniref:zinc-binding dehydrogenase n=1 Tax=Reyranella sp. TaxID=1929291 RepID=UPI003BACEA68